MESNLETCFTHKWELTFNTGVYVLQCSYCDFQKVTSYRHKPCLRCKEGRYDEAAYCWGGHIKRCIHDQNKRHLVFMCTNSKCKDVVVEGI